MDQGRISVRYAKALFELATEKKLIKELKDDMALIGTLCKDESISYLIESPVIKTSEKIKTFSDIFSDKINPLTMNFVKMVTENKREKYLPGICRNFISRYHEHTGIKQAHFATAFAMDQTLIEKVRKTISTVYKAEVELTTSENNELIGGFVLRIGDQQLDTSVATKLRKIKQQFIETSI
jgi:F-type H+-transporting ATPase subunit delta